MKKKQTKYVVTSSKQTYLPITTHFAGQRRFSGKLLSDFWSTSPKMMIFGPEFSLFLSKSPKIPFLGVSVGLKGIQYMER